MKKNKSILLHVGAWLIYTIYIYLTNYVANPNVHLIPTLLFLIPYYITFYIVLYFLRFPIRRKVLWSVIVFFLVFVIMSAFSYIFIYSLLPLFGITLYSSGDLRSFVQGAIVGYGQFFAYALLYYYFSSTLRKERELRILQLENASIEQEKITRELDIVKLTAKEIKTKEEKLAFEYAFLQSQINPHFLYNTLNVLLSQALKISKELAANISKMSEIIRYSMESVEYKITTVPIHKELEHLQILIDINIMRFGNPYFIDFIIEGKAQDHQIPPMAFITIVENAFKYGNIRDGNNPVCIHIKLHPSYVCFFCRNKKKKSTTALTSHHIGIKNLRYRLNAAFNDRYQMDIVDEEEFYSFKLNINHP